MSALTQIPTLLTIIYFTLVDIKYAQFSQYSYITIIFGNFLVLHGFICLFAPVISADGLSSQVNTLKLMLHDQLLDENGKYVLEKSVDIMPANKTLKPVSHIKHECAK